MALAIDLPKVAETMLHYLRIAVTVLSLTACVLLIALWVRSYWWTDQAVAGRVDSPLSASVWSSRGQLGLESTIYLSEVPIFDAWDMRSYSDSQVPRGRLPGFDFYHTGTVVGLLVPHWFAALISASFAATPWIDWSKRFSLRTLLIAMTLVAVVLTIIVVSM